MSNETLFASKNSRKTFLNSLSKEQRLQFLQDEKSEKLSRLEETIRVSNVGIPLVFDLSYTNSMETSEINSTINQIRLSVGFLRKHNKQHFKLITCSTSAEIKETLEKKGSNSWKLEIYKESIVSCPFTNGKTIIMLSPDAEEVLTEINSQAVYVVGGLVDRTVKSYQTLMKAQELGISCMRLPIKESISDVTNPFKLKKVLNINTVVEILHYKASGVSWREAMLGCIPNRWLKNKNINT